MKLHASSIARSLIEVTLSISIGLLGGALALAVFNYDPLGALHVMFSKGFSDLEYLVLKSTPLILSALAFLVPLRAGLFNIGGEGQLYAGALVALYMSKAGYYIAIPAGVLAGGIIGLLIGLLRVYRGVNEVVSSIMFNWVLFYTTLFVISRYLYDPVYTHQSIRVDRMLNLAELTILAVGASLLAYTLLFHTRTGFEIRLMGSSPKAARYAGVNMNLAILQSMFIGGLMGGFAGVLQVYGVTGVVDTTLSSLYGLGFLGIGVALIARANPLAVIPASALVAGLLIGGQWMELRFRVAPELADVIVGIIILSLSAPYAYRLLTSRLWGARIE